MATYLIGDIQGCFQPFQALLKKIHFDIKTDELWIVGDLVNRGPASLEVLRFLVNFPGKLRCVLGNHDLHLLALASGIAKAKPGDTLDEVLSAPDLPQLMDWLKQWPLMYSEKNTIMVHAGIFPFWTLSEAQAHAQEFSDLLRSSNSKTFFEQMYGDFPMHWSNTLTGWKRMRFIVNAFTRMRVLTSDGGLDLKFKQTLADIPSDEKPWFELLLSEYDNKRIVFGHWAALLGETTVPHVFGLDTGCVWGKTLTAFRLEDEQRFSVENTA